MEARKPQMLCVTTACPTKFIIKKDSNQQNVGNTQAKQKEAQKQCDQCSKQFMTKKDLKRHMVVHTGQREFSCLFCHIRFGRRDHLLRHQQLKHSALKRQYLSSEAGNLNLHHSAARTKQQMAVKKKPNEKHQEMSKDDNTVKQLSLQASHVLNLMQSVHELSGTTSSSSSPTAASD